jgi:hypothetical protein
VVVARALLVDQAVTSAFGRLIARAILGNRDPLLDLVQPKRLLVS